MSRLPVTHATGAGAVGPAPARGRYGRRPSSARTRDLVRVRPGLNLPIGPGRVYSDKASMRLFLAPMNSMLSRRYSR